jgi:hypothetical protein
MECLLEVKGSREIEVRGQGNLLSPDPCLLPF